MKRSIRSTLFSTLKALTVAVLLAAPLAAAEQAHAGAAAWQSTNFQYLWGYNFKAGQDLTVKDNNRSTITLEHASGWKYGDNFFFFDITSPSDDDAFIYGEISPRLSLGKITGADLSAPFVKDVLLAGTYEIASSGIRGYLYGVGLSLDLPKFNFADLNLYARNTSNNEGITYQITPVWQLPFTIGKADLLFEGFVDIAGAEGSLSEFNIDAQPRLLLDAGKLWGAPGNLYLGTEIIYWHNKFGIDGVNEFAPQVMVKWVM